MKPQETQVAKTGFAMIEIAEPELSSQPLTLWGHNIREFRQKNRRSGREDHKPPGWGWLGGRVEADELLEVPSEGIVREVLQEGGLKVIPGSVFPLRVKPAEYWLVVRREEGERPEFIEFKKGQRPPIPQVGRTGSVVENHLFLFRAKVEWQGTFLRELLCQKRFRVPDSHGGGAFFFLKDLTRAEIKKLGVKELEEMDGFWLMSQEILTVMDSRDCGVYRSHLLRARREKGITEEGPTKGDIIGTKLYSKEQAVPVDQFPEIAEAKPAEVPTQ